VVRGTLKGILLALRGLLSDKDSKIRAAAADGFEKIAQRRGEGRLTKLHLEAFQDSLPILYDGLKDKDPLVRKQVVQAFATIANGFFSQRKITIPALIEAMLDSNADVRDAAATALVDLKSPKCREDALPGTLALKQNANPLIRRKALTVLAEIGPAQDDVLVAFCDSLTDKDSGVRGEAAQGLLKLVGNGHKEAKKAALPLAVALSDSVPLVRTSAAAAISKLGELAVEAVPTLVLALSNTTLDVRRKAAQVLKSIGTSAKGAIPALKVALADKDLDTRSSAALALHRLGSEERDILPIINETLKLNGTNRDEALAVIAGIGPAAAASVPFVRPYLKDKEPDMRRRAATAIGNIGPKAADASLAIADLLKDKDTSVRLTAAETLGKIGPGAKEATAALCDAFKDSDESVRRAATEAIDRIGPAAVAFLTDALADKDIKARRRAAELLGALGAQAKASVPALVKALKDSDPFVRDNAEKSLKAIGPDAAKQAGVK